MPQVLLVNPAPRRTRKGKTMARKRKWGSPAQRAAFAKMIAARRGTARRSRGRRRSNPVAVNPVAAPARRRKWKRPSARAATAAGRTLRFRRPNPVGFDIGRWASDTLLPSVIGGAGAIGADVLLGVLPLPAALRTGPMRPVVRIGGAIGVGLIASLVASRRTAELVGAGALTVVMYDVIRGVMRNVTGGRVPGLGVYVDGVGEIAEADAADAIGYWAAGQQVGEVDAADDGLTVGNVEMLPDEQVGVYVE